MRRRVEDGSGSHVVDSSFWRAGSRGSCVRAKKGSGNVGSVRWLPRVETAFLDRKMATHGESTAKASSSFHASFAPLLETLQDQIKAATTSEQADAILGQLVQERNNLQERDLAGALTRWDKEQYEKVNKNR